MYWCNQSYFIITMVCATAAIAGINHIKCLGTVGLEHILLFFAPLIPAATAATHHKEYGQQSPKTDRQGIWC